MENGVRVAEGTQVEERNGVEEKLLGLRTEELEVDGSYASKEAEEDELFEEAVEDGASTIGYEEAVNGNVEEFSHADTGIEAEKFDEASETPVEPLNDDDTSNDDVSSQLDRLLDISNKEGEARSTGTADSELYGFEKEEDTINAVGQAFEQAENGVIDHENAADEAVVNHVGNPVRETQGTIDNDAKDGDSGLHPKLESDVLVGLQDELKVEVVNETGGNMDNELVVKRVGLQDALTSSSGNLDVVDQGENIANLITRNDENEQPSQSGRIQEDVEEEKLIVPLDNAADTANNDVSLVDNLAEDSNRSDFLDVGFDGSEPSGDLKEINNEDNEHGQSVPQERQVSAGESSNGSSECQDASSEVFKFVVYEHENEKGEVNPSVLQNKDELDVHDATGTFSCNDTSAVPHQLVGPPHSSMDSRERELIQGNREAITGSSSSSSAPPAASVPAPPAASVPAPPAASVPAPPAASVPASPAASVPAPSRPAGLGRSALLLEPVPRAVHQQQQPRVNGTVSPVQDQLVEDSTNGDGEETDETREKLQMIRVKFLRLAHRLGQTPHNVVVAQVLYRLGLAEQLRGRNGGRVAAFSFDRASAMAEQLEAAGQEPLDFSCTIMVLGKSGVGKSATINSIFDEIKFNTDAFDSGTKKVQDVVGIVQGIKVRVIDTPGLLPSWSDQRKNEKILRSIKQYIKNTPPDIVLYLDRLDMPSRELGDMPLLRTITDIFGPSVWFNAIVVLTHAASAPPEGPNGTTTSYEMFVSQRSQVVQQAIRQAAGDMRLMNPVSLVENHSACRTNRAGQRVLPNGVVWKPHLLLLSFASKILAEANTLLKLQDSPPGKVLASRARSPPLPFLLSSLLQSRPPVKLPVEQYGEDDDLDDDLNDSSDSDDESEYDELPPFKRLTKAELANLSRDQRKAYFKELEYREKLFMKKQLKEEKTRRKMMKKMQSAMQDLPSDYQENAEEESGGTGSIPVPMPDLALPASFDSDNPTHRYRYLDSSQWLVRPVLDTHGWDHDVGYEGINLERLLVVKDKIPVSLSGQISKDKKDTNLQLEMASTVKHSEGKVTSLGFDLQSVGKDMAYTIRSETRFSNWKHNKAVAGLAATLLGDVLTGGLKIEDKLIVNKQAQLVMSAGAMLGRADVAYGGSLEATLRDKDHPLGRFLSTLGVSVMDWRGDLAIGYNCQCQIPVGRATNLIGRVNVNNRGSGQVSIRVNSSDMLQIAFVGLVPLLRKMFSNSQPGQFG